METFKVRTWNGFVKAINKIRKEYGVYKKVLDNGKEYERKNQLLFRGQSNSKWSLMTTLERKTDEPHDVYKYLLKAWRAASELESFTGTSWNLTSFRNLENEVNTNQNSFDVYLPSYDYLVYLRHHGFPSPLLDWSESPYIAAFFAYINAEPNTDVSVYCYLEWPKSGKNRTGGEPQIHVKGPYVKTHKRHFAQKAWYTISTQWNYAEKKHYFCIHEKVFKKNQTDQDLLFKIIIPGKLRKEVLETLNDYNINHFTLFQSEDALVKAIEYKEFELRE